MSELNLKKYTADIGGEEIILYDVATSKTLDWVIPEAIRGDEYKIQSMTFSPGDVVIDVGANVGSVSIMLAKKFPFIRIYSYEAHPINYNNLLRNIKENNVENITAFNYAVYSEDGYSLEMSLNVDNTGASNAYADVETHPELYASEYARIEVPTISLDTIISSNNIDKIKFLKMDCEGAEFEIVENSKLIHKVPVEHFACEIHLFMENLGKSVNELIKTLNGISKTPPTIKLSGL